MRTSGRYIKFWLDEDIEEALQDCSQARYTDGKVNPTINAVLLDYFRFEIEKIKARKQAEMKEGKII
jgi:hypothetical protein